MKKLFIFLVIFALWVLPVIAQADPSLVGYWKFDEGAGTVAYDSSGHGNNGTLKNGPIWVNGKFGKALEFDGVDDYVMIPDSPSLDINGPGITFMAWIYSPGFQDLGWIMGKGDWDWGKMVWWLLPKSDGAIRYGIKSGGTTHEQGNIPVGLTTNIWQHVAVVYDGSYMRFYLNAVEKDSFPKTGNMDVNDVPVLIGLDGWNTNNHYRGKIDQVKVYNRALSPEEIWAEFGGQGIIAGTVKDKSTQQSLQGVLVEALILGSVLGSDNTDSIGRYTINNLWPGTYDVRASKSGYQTQMQYGKPVVLGQTTIVDFQLVNLSQLSVEVKIDSFIQNTPTNTIAFTYSVENDTIGQIVVSGVITADTQTIATFSWMPMGPGVKWYDILYYPLPESTWENKTIKVEVQKINGWPVSIADSIEVSVYYLADQGGSPYSRPRDAYGFRNPSLSSKQFEQLLYKYLGTNRENNAYLYPYTYHGSDGHCYGMAQSSNAYFIDPSKKPPSGRGIPTHAMSWDSSDVKYYIILHHQYQSSSVSKSKRIWYPLYGLTAIQDSIVSWLRQSKPFVVNFGDSVSCVGGGWGWERGHSDAAYAMIKFGTDHSPNDSSWLYLYENNDTVFPGIAIFRNKPPSFCYKSWRYISSIEQTPDIRIDFTIQNAILWFWHNRYQCLHPGSFLFSPSQAIYNDLPLSFALSGSDKLLITDRYGRRAGYVATDSFVNEIPDAVVSPGGGIGDTNRVVVIYVPKDDGYTISMFSQRTDTLDIVAICPETDSTITNFLYMDLPVVSGSQGTIQYDPHGASILNLDRDGNGTPDTAIAPLVGMAPFPFDLLWPPGGGRVNGTFPLKWQSSLNMDYQDTIFYQAYFAKDSLFSSPESTVVTRDTTINVGNLDTNTTYYWKVKAFDTQGNFIWSQLDSFRVVTFKPGDANADGKVSVSDVIYLINYLFKGGPAPVPLEAGDPNFDGKATVADVVYLINYLFKGGLPPSF